MHCKSLLLLFKVFYLKIKKVKDLPRGVPNAAPGAVLNMEGENFLKNFPTFAQTVL